MKYLTKKNIYFFIFLFFLILFLLLHKQLNNINDTKKIQNIKLVQNKSKKKIIGKITVYGAAEKVSGSLSILQVENNKWMIDCGDFYPEGKGTIIERINNANKLSSQLPPGSDKVNAVLLTHAHEDHIGRVILLTRNGFKNAIYVTKGTFEIISLLIDDQINYNDFVTPVECIFSSKKFENIKNTGKGFLTVHWNINCAGAKKILFGSYPGKFSGTLSGLKIKLGTFFPGNNSMIKKCKICCNLEKNDILKLFKVIQFGTRTGLAKDVFFEFLKTEHIPGAASILFIIRNDKKILFSGDLGTGISTIYNSPPKAPEADIVFIETTYGAEYRKPEITGEAGIFRKKIAETIKNNRICWIPAASLDRTQKILNQLKIAQQEGLLNEDIPIYTPSPSATRITGLYKKYRDSDWFNTAIRKNDNAWQPEGMTNSYFNINHLERPCIIITSDGTMEFGTSKKLLPLLNYPFVTVFLVQYQDPDSPGGQIKSGKKIISIDNKKIEVFANHYFFDCFTGHPDAKEANEWLKNISKNLTIVLVHGMLSNLKKRKTDLEQRGWTDVLIAAPQEPVDITMNK